MARTVFPVIFNASSTFHENRPIAVRIAKSGSSMNIKSYQFVVSIIGLSTLLAQILFSINSKSGPSSWGVRAIWKKEFALAPQLVTCAYLLNPDDKEVRRIKGEALYKSL